MILRRLAILILASVQSFAIASEIIRTSGLQKAVHPQNDYYIALLNLALTKTLDTHGKFEITSIEKNMFQRRQMQALIKGQIDIMWTMSTIDREQFALPIKIPLTKGLIGYRVFMIRDGEQERFHNLEGLKKMKALQGHDWPDTQILLHNGFHVETTTLYQSLFKMLNDGYVDYVPRGIMEAFAEEKAHADLNVHIENKFLLRYPAAIYFFVSPNNPKLAQRIKQGLTLANQDGSFDQLLYNHPKHKNIWQQLKSHQRTLVTLENPLLPKDTQLNDKRLWLSPNQIPQSTN